MSVDEDKRTVTTVTLHTITWFLTTLLSLTGNSLICVAFYNNRRLLTITNFFVLSFTLIDLIAASFGYPFNTISSGLRRWPFGHNFCQFNGFLSHFWTVASIHMLALTAMNRYFCIIKPRFYSILFTREKTARSIILVWLCTLTGGLALTFATPLVFRWHPYYLFCQIESSETLPAPTSTILTVYTFLLISLTLFCYAAVYLAIKWHNSAIIPSLTGPRDHQANNINSHEIQASRILLIAVLVFFVCWIPATVVSTIERVARQDVLSFWQSFDTLVFACTSWINPIIYVIMSRAMRKEIIKILHCRKGNWWTHTTWVKL